jgi:hypothetical protein
MYDGYTYETISFNQIYVKNLLFYSCQITSQFCNQNLKLHSNLCVFSRFCIISFKLITYLFVHVLISVF